MEDTVRPAAPPTQACPARVVAAEVMDCRGAGATALADVETATAAMLRISASVQDAASWSADQRQAMLERLDRIVDGFAAVRAGILVAEHQSGTWQGSGDRSFEAWRARTSRAGERSAAAQVRLADQLAAVPAAAAAVTDGRITLEHAAVIAKAASTGTPAQRGAAQCPAGQEHLLGLAEELDAGSLATSVARWAARIDPGALEADHQAQRRERFLHVADTPRGTFVKGRLDRMAGHRLILALEALTPRPAADDDRDPGQRRADALETMASRILGSADTKPGGHVPPQVSLILSEETWVAARADRDRRRAQAAGAAPAQDAGGGYPPATLENGTPVPASELASVMCDCEVTRIAIDADGVPLDLGRTRRLFTGEQRRAIIARDRECIWPGCHAPARWCEIHHILWWERDTGPTSVDNGALLCVYHHHETHRRDLTITRIRRGESSVRRRRRSAIALVNYEFRDPAGRLVGGPPALRREADAGTRSPEAAQMGRVDVERATAPAGAALDVGPTEPDELDLGWTTDPITGTRVPAFLLSG